MASWTITRTDTDQRLAAGSAPNVRLAWARLMPALLTHLADRSATDPHGYTITIDQDPPSFVFPGRDDTGHVDLPETRAALERMAIASMGPAVFADPDR